MKITNTFYPKTRSEWREWLSKNHNKEKDIWLVYFKKKTGKPTISYADAVDEALCFGWIESLEKGIDDERYAQRFTPRSMKSSWTKTNVARYIALMKQGLVAPAGKKAFDEKGKIYTPTKMTPEPVAWHKENRMPKNPSLEDRITWHRGHKKYCGCREVPMSLQKYF